MFGVSSSLLSDRVNIVSPWLYKDIKVLEYVQKRAIRMTSGLSGSNYEEKLKEVNMLSLTA